MNVDYNIFISYRGNSEISCKFAEKLYETIFNLVGGEDDIGNPFYSKVQDLGNFMEDIPSIMEKVDYFILPFDQNYLDSFLTPGGSINLDSVTRQEIDVALDKGCKFFLPVSLDGSNLDAFHLKAIFKDYKKISCAKKAFIIDKSLNEEDAINELILRVCEAIYKEKNKTVDKGSNNVYMQFKNESEKKCLKNLGANKICFVNIAATSIASSLDIADTYIRHSLYKSWFAYSVKTGKMDVSVVIINPDSRAAVDAEKYKMYPRGLSKAKDEIIRCNLETLLELKATYRESRIRIYLTDVALPYALQVIEFPDERKNKIKLDLYSPFLSSDDKRPSFTLYKCEESTSRLYDFFSENADNVINNSVEIKTHEYSGNWLYDTQIIHRANLDNKYPSMTKGAFIHCIDNLVPIEVDISILADDELWVGRDRKIDINGVEKNISECTRKELEIFRAQSVSSNDDFLFLDEFLKLIENKIPVLFEIKCDIDYTIDENINISKKMAGLFLDQMENFSGEYAVMSSNTYVIKKVKEDKPQILCGQITMNMGNYKGISDSVIQMHNENKYIDIFKPDFIACRIEDIKDKYMVTFCVQNNLPLLGWVADSEQKLQMGRCCTNLIAENIK